MSRRKLVELAREMELKVEKGELTREDALSALSQVERALSQLIQEGIQIEADPTMLRRISSARDKLRETMRNMGFNKKF